MRKMKKKRYRLKASVRRRLKYSFIAIVCLMVVLGHYCFIKPAYTMTIKELETEEAETPDVEEEVEEKEEKPEVEKSSEEKSSQKEESSQEESKQEETPKEESSVHSNQDEEKTDETTPETEPEQSSALTFKQTQGDVVVMVEAPEGALPEGTKMHLETLDQDAVLQNMMNLLDDNQTISQLQAYQVRFTCDGIEVLPSQKVTITITSPLAGDEEHFIFKGLNNSNQPAVITKVDIDASSQSVTYKTDEDFRFVLALSEEVEEGVLTCTYNRYVFKLHYTGVLPKDARLTLKKDDSDEGRMNAFTAYSTLRKNLYMTMLGELHMFKLEIRNSEGQIVLPEGDTYITVNYANQPTKGHDLMIAYASDDEAVLLGQESDDVDLTIQAINPELKGQIVILSGYVTDNIKSVAEPAIDN